MLRRAEWVIFGCVGQIIIHQIPAAADPLFASMIGLVKYDHGSSSVALIYPACAVAPLGV